MGGSKPRQVVSFSRDKAKVHDRIWKDYFNAIHVYGDKLFWSHYNIKRSLFFRIIPMTSNWNWYMGEFWNPSYGHPWTIPKTILKITT